MATGTYFLLCEAGKAGGFGPYVGFDAEAGFKLTMVVDRSDAKRYFDRAAVEADQVNLAAQFGALEIEERIGVVNKAVAMNPLKQMVVAPSGEGKSVLDTLLLLQGVPFVSGPVHTDGPAEFAEANRAAHDIEACLPHLHDTVLEATGKSLSDAELRALMDTLPTEIKEQIDDWGLADTEVNEQIFAHLRHAGV